MNRIALIAACGGICSIASAGGIPLTIDFSTDDGGAPLVNGQEINVGEEFGNIVNISSPDGRLGIFDTDPAGPNAGGGDADLLVGLGNALIAQNSSLLTQTVPDIFDTPNDSAGSTQMTFDLLGNFEMLSLTLIDINGGVTVDVVLTDSNGLTRTYDVPERWTFDVSVSPLGYGVLDLTTLADQDEEGSGGPATASEMAGFDATSVTQMDVFFTGSAAIDNIILIPAPGAATLMGLGLLGVAGRRRR